MTRPITAEVSHEYYKLQAAEFLARYEAMRSLEWQTLIQTYAGYAAIIIAFQKVLGDPNGPQRGWLIPGVAMIATLIFFGAMHYLHYRVQERLITFNETHDYYVHKTFGQVPDEGWGTKHLGHKYFWTYDAQMVVSVFAVVGMLAYEAAQGVPVWWRIAMTALFVVLLGVWSNGRWRNLSTLPARMRASEHKRSVHQ